VLRAIRALGANRVSSKLVVENWVAQGKHCDDVFFLHFDMLLNYGFVKQQTITENALTLDELLAFNQEHDSLLSITHEGLEFLDRYGNS
jgi:hypothetical protein